MLFVFEGGTIDITSYEIQNDSQLKEIDRPSGGPWGGTYVDQEYIKFLQVLFGSDVWKAFEKDAPEDVLEIKRKFEAKKRGTKHNDKTKTTIPYPQSLYSTYSKLKNVTDFGNTLRDSKFSQTVTKTNEKLRYNPEIIVEFFSKSINSISSKVNELLSFAKRKGNHIEAILMVGGYSDSPILQERMRNDFKDLKIICPQDAVLAVVKGAVMFGHNPQLISERICPRTYGITVNVPYDERKHPSKLKAIIEGKEMCSDVFKVMVKKGDPLVVGKTKYDILCNPTRSTDSEATVEVYESDSEYPMYTIDKGVKRLGMLTVPIPDVERGKMRKIRIEMQFGYTELIVTASEDGSGEKKNTKFECLMK